MRPELGRRASPVFAASRLSARPTYGKWWCVGHMVVCRRQPKIYCSLFYGEVDPQRCDSCRVTLFICGVLVYEESSKIYALSTIVYSCCRNVSPTTTDLYDNATSNESLMKPLCIALNDMRFLTEPFLNVFNTKGKCDIGKLCKMPDIKAIIADLTILRWRW